MRKKNTAAMRLAIRAKYRRNVKSGRWAYSDRFDSYYDTKTLKWIEKGCRDKECMYCADRPKTAPKKRHSGDKHG